jgi:hypothetical protein
MHCEHCKDKKMTIAKKSARNKKKQDNQSTYWNYKNTKRNLIKTMIPIKRIWIEVFWVDTLYFWFPLGWVRLHVFWFYESAGYEILRQQIPFTKSRPGERSRFFCRNNPHTSYMHIYIYIYISGLIPDKYPKAIQIPGPTLVWRPSPAWIIITIIIFWIFFPQKE